MCTVRIEVQSPELCVNYNYSCCLAFLRSFLTQIPWQPKCRQLIGKKKVKSPAPEVYDMLIKKSARRCNNPFGNHWVAQQIAGWLTSWLVLIMTNREPVLLFFSDDSDPFCLTWGLLLDPKSFGQTGKTLPGELEIFVFYFCSSVL